MNSAIAVPHHNEILYFHPQRETPEYLHQRGPNYTIRGYAYSGGGKRVNRVEVSLDEGGSWELAEMLV